MKKRLLWKVPLIVVGALLILTLLLMGVASMVLTPERLTRWTRDYGTKYLVEGQVNVDRVDLSIWSTFPHAVLEVEGLEVVNNHHALPDSLRRVIAVERLAGNVNLLKAMFGHISVSNVEITNPEATYWVGPDSLTSLSILPKSEPQPQSVDPVSLPDIKVSRFAIAGEARARYIVPADSIDMAVVLTQTLLQGPGRYSLGVSGATSGLLPHIHEPLTLGINGNILWDSASPLTIGLDNLEVDFDQASTLWSMSVDLADLIKVNALDFELKPLRLGRIAALADAIPVNGNAAIGASAKLLSPYTITDSLTELPHLRAEIYIADAPVEIPDAYLKLENLALAIEADIQPAGLDSSVITLKRLNTRFPASDFTLEATATNLTSDPQLKGCLKGDINFSNLNPRLWTLLGMRLRGTAEADFDFDLNLSDLTPNTFHRALLTGNLTLHDFHALMPADSLAAGATTAHFRFGTEDKVAQVDSLLTATLTVDSAWVFMPELTAELSKLKLGVGIENRAATTDTTTVTPMGGRLTLGTLRYQSTADSSRAVVRDLAGGISLKRFKGNDRAPQIVAQLNAKRIMYAAGRERMALRGVEINAQAHASKGKPQKPRTRRDSTRWAARRDSMLLAHRGEETIDFDIDRSMITLLRKWNVSGSIRAEKGRVVTPAFPLRTSMANLDFGFNADSLMLKSLTLKAGQSDLALRGLVSNMQNALGRKNAQPLNVRLEIISDTLNVNELVYALTHDAGNAVADIDDEDATVDADTITLAPVIPMNIDAKLLFKAKNVLYTTLQLHDFSGEVLVANGAANLHDLHADSDVGGIDLNMLYSAPTRADVNFGLGLDLRRINIGQVGQVIPALDTIMPILNTLGGLVDVDISATTPVDSFLNINMPQLKAMVRLRGDSLKVLDEQTFKTVSKWLLFRDKKRNLIDHAEAQLAVENNVMQLYPFMFDFDRYRIGVMGHNDLDMNLNYHISILKSPIPFRFGINIKGTTEKMKIRLGRARFKEEMAAQSVAMADTVRINLANEIRNAFARGTKASIRFQAPEKVAEVNEDSDTIPSDSLYLWNAPSL